jgi:uncharacterized ion transporter superfamily protein YfcC
MSLPKLSTLKYNFAPVLRNKFILYAFLAMTLVQVLFFVNSGDITAVVTMGLIGFLTSFFSKNMIVIMFVALTVSSLLTYGIRANAYEGIENQEDEQEAKSEEPAKADEKKPEEKTEEKKPKKEETEEFVAVQKQILDGVAKMEPLLQKAEAFMDKFPNAK